MKLVIERKMKTVNMFTAVVGICWLSGMGVEESDCRTFGSAARLATGNSHLATPGQDLCTFWSLGEGKSGVTHLLPINNPYLSHHNPYFGKNPVFPEPVATRHQPIFIPSQPVVKKWVNLVFFDQWSCCAKFGNSTCRKDLIRQLRRQNNRLPALCLQIW